LEERFSHALEPVQCCGEGYPKFSASRVSRPMTCFLGYSTLESGVNGGDSQPPWKLWEIPIKRQGVCVLLHVFPGVHMAQLPHGNLGGHVTSWLFIFKKKFLFYSYVHTMFGSFLSPSPCHPPLSHLTPSPPPATSLTPPYPWLPGRNYSAFISNFVEERV
jgi:hypothetical protein